MQARATVRELARLWGVQESYRDTEGRIRKASDEALVAVAAALGAPIPEAGATTREVEAAMGARRREIWRQVVEPVLVARDGVLASVLLRVAQREASGTARFAITPEDGPVISVAGDLDVRHLSAMAGVDGAVHIQIQVPVRLRLPTGYHRLEVSAAGLSGSALIISAPSRAPSGHGDRLWGVFAPLYALHSAHSIGLGDLGDLHDLLEFIGGLGGSLVATLPLLATFLDEPLEPSPYSPVSRLFWNEAYLDLRAVPEVAASDAARAALEEAQRRFGIPDGPDPGWVDYRAVAAAKRGVLEVALRSQGGTDGRRRGALEALAASRPALDAYATFRAACEHFRSPWPCWPGEAAAGRLGPGEVPPEARAYHRVAQLLTEEQIGGAVAGTGAALLFDLPLGGHPAGYDVWAHQDLFLRGLTTGAPPDALNRGGQDWGNPPLHPDRLRSTGYAYPIACVRHLLAHSGALRIDHVMGLHRAYVLPRRDLAGDGAYLRYHPDEAYAILCLEAHRARGGAGALLVGEDLGTVPDYVRRAMASRGILRCYVGQFATEEEGIAGPGLRPVPAETFATLNTHDVASFAAWWHGDDIDQARDLGLFTPEQAAGQATERSAAKAAVVVALRRAGLLEGGDDPASGEAVFDAWVAWLGRSPGRAVALALEDLWGERSPQNIPGTTSEYPNWQRRAAHSMESIRCMPMVVGRLQAIDRARRDGMQP
ncbi:MAG TPA: 4-alpha-glucanotransferase [Actinomycetota bacterium]|nr:4-alpha-glucanotransferase [Actinomycetota bacterium]